MSEKQTPVEYLTIQVNKQIPTIHNDALIDDFNKALEMEREQISDLQARLDLAVKALEDIGNEFLGQKGYESLATYLDTITQIKGGADDNG